MNLSMKLRLAPLFLLAFVATSCRSRTDRSEGSVILSISMFDQLPLSVSVANGPTQLGTITLRSVAKDPTGTTSSLQDIEVRSYEVRFARLDTGTRLPAPLVEAQFGTVPVNSTAAFTNLAFLRSAQLNSPPLSDLANFGSDQQTGSRVIPLRVTLRFFGRTLAGDDIVSAPASFDIEVVP